MYQKIKLYLKSRVQAKYPGVIRFIHNYKIIIKYLISGSLAVLSNLLVMYLLTDIFSLWYVASSVFAFLVSVSLGFYLQKYWTFRDNTMNRIKRQMAIYLSVGIFNLILGPSLLVFFVEIFGIWYLLGQFMSLSVLAMESYLINRFITFRKAEQL